MKNENTSLLEKIERIDKDLKVLNEKELESRIYIDKLTEIEGKFDLLMKERDANIEVLEMDINRFLIFIKLFCFHTHYLLVLFLVLLRGQFKDIFTSFSPLRRPCPSRLHNKKIKNRQLTPSKY